MPPLSDETLSAMQKMLDDGSSAGEIAAAHGVTRNSVCGMIHRGKLRRFGRPAVPGRKPAPEKKPKPSPAIRIARPAAPEPEPLAVEVFIPRAEAFRPVERGEGVAIRNILGAMCKWPLGTFDEVSTRLCGDPTGHFTKAYCSAHHKLAYVPRAVSERQRAAWKRRLAPASGAQR